MHRPFRVVRELGCSDDTRRANEVGDGEVQKLEAPRLLCTPTVGELQRWRKQVALSRA